MHEKRLNICNSCFHSPKFVLLFCATYSQQFQKVTCFDRIQRVLIKISGARRIWKRNDSISCTVILKQLKETWFSVWKAKRKEIRCLIEIVANMSKSPLFIWLKVVPQTNNTLHDKSFVLGKMLVYGNTGLMKFEWDKKLKMSFGRVSFRKTIFFSFSEWDLISFQPIILFKPPIR